MKIPTGYDQGVQSPVPIRFTEKQMEGIDLAVEEGTAASRGDAIRRAVEHYLGRLESRRNGEATREAYRRMPETAAELRAAEACAIAYVEAQPW